MKLRLFLSFFLFTLCYIITHIDIISKGQQILFLSELLFFYVLFELFLEYKKEKTFYFIKTIFIFSCFNFLLIFGGFTNYFLLDDNYNFLFKYSRYPDDAITIKIIQVITYAILSSNALFYGYNIININNFKRVYLNWLNTFVKNKEFNINLLILIGIIGNTIRLYMFENGLYGRIIYLSNNNSIFLSRFQIFDQISSVILLLLVYSIVFSKCKFKITQYIFFYLLFFLEIMFKSISGARSPIVILCLSILFLFYLKSGKIKLKYILTFIFVLIFSFTILSDIKYYVTSNNTDAVGVNPVTFIKDFSNTTNTDNLTTYKILGQALIVSTNFVEDAAVGIYYMNTFEMPKNTPPFKQMLLIAPINAIIPISIFGLETYSNLGYWFRTEMLSTETFDTGTHSAAMSPITFLYFAFGITGVIVFFFIFGILLKFIDSLITGDFYEKIIYIIVLIPTVFLDSGVHGTVSTILRILFYFPIFFYLISKKAI